MYHHVYTTPHKCHQTKPSVVEDSCLNVLHHVVSWHLKEEVCGLADAVLGKSTSNPLQPKKISITNNPLQITKSETHGLEKIPGNMNIDR